MIGGGQHQSMVSNKSHGSPNSNGGKGSARSPTTQRYRPIQLKIQTLSNLNLQNVSKMSGADFSGPYKLEDPNKSNQEIEMM